ncbi:transposase [Thiolapillus sp.]|uniref:transposase n=1 Tax=Thiolapillus sp. TaxID=2017437 RepID=UPI003AF822A8
MIDFGTSQSPKSTRPLTTYWCPSRPGHQALRNNFASSLLLRTWLPMTGRRVRRPTLFSLWRKARRENSAASRLLGSTSLRFALHGWQRLFANRTSTHAWWDNQFRLLLSSLAYVLMDAIRRQAFKGTKLANAQMTMIRLKLLKIGTVILHNTRCVCFLLSSAYQHQSLFLNTAARLRPP